MSDKLNSQATSASADGVEGLVAPSVDGDSLLTGEVAVARPMARLRNGTMLAASEASETASKVAALLAADSYANLAAVDLAVVAARGCLRDGPTSIRGFWPHDLKQAGLLDADGRMSSAVRDVIESMIDVAEGKPWGGQVDFSATVRISPIAGAEGLLIEAGTPTHALEAIRTRQATTVVA